MKKSIILTLVFFASIGVANAKIKVPFCFPCEKIATIKELPDTSSVVGEGNEHLNIAYKYNEYGAIWIPVWNTGGTYVLTNKDETKYYEISEDEVAELAKTYQFDRASNPVSFWSKFGGKMLLILVIGFIIWGQIPSKKISSYL